MMMTSLICLDANLTLKLVLNESDSTQAQALWADWNQRNLITVAPPLWGYEVTSVIRNQVHHQLLPPELGQAMFDTIHQLSVRLLQPNDLHKRAWELANRFNRPAAYDAHYLALAELVACPFWTADERLYNTVRDELNWVYWLGNYTP